jgi:Na+/H+ antiporter NhaD/arsenite permease-like protein
LAGATDGGGDDEGSGYVDWVVLAVFAAVYAGMILGRFPGMALDRTGVALLGAIALLAVGRVRTDELAAAIDAPTLVLLFALMVVSAQFRLSGFYSSLVRRVEAVRVSPPMLLGLLIALTAALSAVLANDIVCLAVAPVLVAGCGRRGLDPKPFLLALACAANVGSAATLIGNPQNMLIGQVLRMDFAGYLLLAAGPAVMGLGVVWGVICWQTRGRWRSESPGVTAAEAPAFDRWQTGKGLTVLAAVVALFLAAPWPREIVALAAAGLLLCSRRMHSRRMLGLVDWQLLVLFAGLFVVNHAVRTSGMSAQFNTALAAAGAPVEHPAWLFGLSAALSNLVSNVPAVMLLLPYAHGPQAGAVLALSSTLAGTLLVVGSIANIIVLEQASRMGVKITWRQHAKVGVPVTLGTLAVAAAWLWLWGR